MTLGRLARNVGSVAWGLTVGNPYLVAMLAGLTLAMVAANAAGDPDHRPYYFGIGGLVVVAMMLHVGVSAAGEAAYRRARERAEKSLAETPAPTDPERVA